MTETLPAAIQAFVDATNAGDTEAFLDAFTEDGSLNDWGREVQGRDGLASWNQTDNIGKQSHFEVESFEQDGTDRYIVVLTVSGNGYNGTGPMTFILHGDRIARLEITPN